VRAHPNVDAQVSGSLVDALDPVTLSGRSLTTPITLHYLDDELAPGIKLVSVVPGQPGPADDEPAPPPTKPARG